MIGFFTLPFFAIFFAIFFALIVFPTTGFFCFFDALLFACFFDFDADFAMENLPGYGVVTSWISRIFT
jgi:hypothetical protein